MPEYYVRLDNDSEAIGPMNEDQLKLLVQEGKISKETKCFYDDIVGWQPIGENQALNQALFNEASTEASENPFGEEGPKPKLSLKKRMSVDKSSPNPKAQKKNESTAKEDLSVEQMLQSSQGKTKETAHITKQTRLKNITASLSLPVLTLLHLGMGALLIFSQYTQLLQFIEQPNWNIIWTNPHLVLGTVITALGILMLLAVTEVYMVARYVAMILMGYFLMDAYNHLYEGVVQGWGLLATGLCYGFGVFWASSTLRIEQFACAAILGVAGIGSYLWVWMSLAQAS